MNTHEVTRHIEDTLNRLEDAREAFQEWAKTQAAVEPISRRKVRHTAEGPPIVDTHLPPDLSEAIENLPGAQAVLLRIANLQRDLKTAEAELNALVAKRYPKKRYFGALRSAEGSINELIRKLEALTLNDLLDEKFGRHDSRFTRAARDIAKLDKRYTKFDFAYTSVLPLDGEIPQELADKAHKSVIAAFEKVLSLLEEDAVAA